MESIINIKQFSLCIASCKEVESDGLLTTRNGETILSVFNGVTAIQCILPEIKGEYNTIIDLNTLHKLCKIIKENDILKLDIKEDYIDASIKNTRTEKKYSFPNINNDKLQEKNKELNSLINIDAENEIKTSADFIIEQTDSLLFKDDKDTQKVIFTLKNNFFGLSDNEPTRGKSTISLLYFDKFKINYKKDCTLRINIKLIIGILEQLKKFSDSLTLKIQSDYPMKLWSENNKYKITMITAPVVSNE
jgi:hypothetical protein